MQSGTPVSGSRKTGSILGGTTPASFLRKLNQRAVLPSARRSRSSGASDQMLSRSIIPSRQNNRHSELVNRPGINQERVDTEND
jgi:hypothetical protein